MHVQTHVLSGWCVGNLLPLNARERMMCMLAASLADLDGVGRVVSEELYWDYHHVVGHGAAFGLLLAVTLTAFSTHRRLAFFTYLGLFHLHLALDLLGSGPDWPIHYGWPMTSPVWENPHSWLLYSWQNITAAFALVAWTVWIAIRMGRTPLERFMPSLDAKLVAWLQGFDAPRSITGRRGGGRGLGGAHG